MDDAIDQERIAEVKSKRDVVAKPVADHAHAMKDKVVDDVKAEHGANAPAVDPVEVIPPRSGDSS